MADITADLLYFNGINGATGAYGLPPMTDGELAGLIQDDMDPALLRELRRRREHRRRVTRALVEGINPTKLAQTGWGVIFANDCEPAIHEALSPLLALRREQAGDRYRCFRRNEGYRVGRDSKIRFLARNDVGPGPVNPGILPYYLLLVGSPEQIPFRFQTQLDVQFAVGRIDFGRDLDAYANYARSVVAAETGHLNRSRRMAFFGVSNEGDPATRMSSELLIPPLLEHVREQKPDWRVQAFLEDRAYKSDLTSLLGGSETPALLFTASHGMEFPVDDPRWLPHQGALLCQDWPGPEAWRDRGPIPQDYYFAGDDLGRDADLFGLIGFFFACFGCGTPSQSSVSTSSLQEDSGASRAFLSNLPTRMLSNPGGGALAVIGHVERAWGCSFAWPGAGSQTAVFESTLDRLLLGHPVGYAVEYFNERYAELATLLTEMREHAEYGDRTDARALARMWTAHNDARDYVILGDPAVRLPR